MINWLVAILSETDFLPHRFCIGSSVWLLSVSVLSNLLIFLAYFSIPLTLAYFLDKREQQVVRFTGWLFAAFIFACGITHLFHAITYWYPLYWLQASLDGLTAIVSVYTAIYLWPLLPKLLHLPNPEQLLKLNQQLQLEICERKAIEEHLQQEVNFSKTLMNSLPGIFYRLDVNGRLVDWNDAFSALLGEEGLKIAQANVLGIIAEQHRLLIANKIAEGFAKGYVDAEAELKVADGQNRWFYFTGKTLTINKQIYLLGTGIDICERKRIENEVLATKNQLQATIEAIPDLLFEIDLDGRYYDYHAHRSELLAAPPEQLLGKTIYEVLPSEAAKVVMAALHEVLEQGWSTGKQICLELAPGTYWFELSAAMKPVDNEQSPHFIVLSRDITERKQSEAAIAESRNLLRTVLDTVPVRIFWKDCNLDYLGCNMAFAEDAGMLEPNDVIGKDDFQMGWKAQAELYRADDREVIGSGMAKLSYDQPLTTPYGQRVWIRTSKVVLKNQNNETIGLLGVYEDISERKQIEEKLRESEARLNALFENMGSGVAIYQAVDAGADFCFSGFNQAAELIENISRADVLGKKLTEAFPKVEEIGFLGLLQRVWKTGVAEHFPMVFYQDARVFGWRENYVYKLPTDEIVAIYDDVTELKQMEQSLRDSEAKFRHLLKMLPIPLAYSNADGRIEYSNDRFQELFGYTPEDIPTLKEWWLRAYPDEKYRQQVMAVWDEEQQMAVAENRDVKPLEYEVTCKNGQVRVMEISGINIEGNFLATFVDMTARTLAERALHRESEKNLALLRNASDGIHILNSAGNVIEISDSFCAMLGYRRDELIKMNVTEWDVSFSAAECLKAVAQMFTKKARSLFETRHRCKDGSVIEVEVSGFPLELDGQPVLFCSSRDITQRKQVEQYEQFRNNIMELLAGDNRLTHILEAIVRGIERLNPAMLCSILLLDQQGKHFANGIAPSLPDFYNDAVKSVEIGFGVGSCGTAAFTGERVIVEDIATHPFWASYKELAARAGLGACWSQPIRSASTQILGTFAIYHHEAHIPEKSDLELIEQSARLTSIAIERKKIEVELRELNRDFITFLENTSDFIYFKNQDSRIRFCSQTLASITHHNSWRDLIGKHDFEIFPEETAQIYYQEELPVFSKGEALINKINPYYDENGGQGWVSTSKWPVFDSDNRTVIGIFGISRDITQLKKTEQNLQESEFMLKEAQEIAHLGHWILDVPSNELYWSDEIYRIFGVLPQEFQATYQAFLDYVHPDDRSFVEYSYSSHLLSKADYAIEHRILLKDGTIKHVSEKCKTEFSEDGQPLRSLGIVLDITERKQAVELLQEKTTALLRSNADLEQFAYSVSHDMRQPLRSVASHLQLLSRSLKEKIDEDERENLSFALEGAKRMDAMILSLLEYSRVGRKTDSKEWISSRAVLEEALEFLAPAMQEMKVEIKITGEWGQVFASEDELSRLFMNLISNAIKYREANQPPQIEIDSSVTEELWSVRVRDYGIGINPQQIDRLFQFFSRLQSRTRFEGAGMGLALCRRIVEHHDGRIWVESAGEGQGCCFRFELPLLESGKAEQL